MTAKLRYFSLVTLVAMAFVMLAPTATAQDDVVTLLFRQNDEPTQVPGLFDAVDRWNEANPNIQVEYETVPWSDAQDQWVREVQAGGGPDVAQIAFVWTRDLAINNLVTNLDPFIESSPPGAGIEDFLGTDLGVYEDSIYGIPWSVDTFVIPYRPDFFEAAGIEAFPQDWESFYEVAAQLTQDTDGDGRTDQFGFCFPAGSGPTAGMWFLVNYYLWSRGEFFVEPTEDGSSWQVGVTAESVQGAMDYYNRFFEEGITPQSLIAVTSWGDPELVGGIGRGDCAMGFMPPATFRAAIAQSDAPLATGPIPQGPEGRISHLGGRTLVLNPNTEYPEEAWEFLKYLASANTFESYTEYPAQQSLLSELEFPEAEQGYVEQLPFAITFSQYILSPSPVSAMWDAVNREFAAVYSGQKASEQAAVDLVDTMNEILNDNME